MSAKDHEEWNKLKEWHKDEPYGCYMRHPFTNPPPNYRTIKYPACDYQFNGFNTAKSSYPEMYNKDHYARAQRKGLVGVDGRQKLAQQVAAQNKGSDWERSMTERIQSPFGLLERDRKAWHIGHTFAGGKVKPWFGKDRTEIDPSQKKFQNFLPYLHDGWYSQYPYKHNYHHLVPNGAFRELVLNAESSGKATPETRRRAVIDSKWNINEGPNVILLPSELAIASVCGLPAHCPWNTMDHPSYSRKIETDLDAVRQKIDKAAATEDHKDALSAMIQLRNTEDQLRKKIKQLRNAL